MEELLPEMRQDEMRETRCDETRRSV